MKKKNSVTKKDKKDWLAFVNRQESLYDKDSSISKQINVFNRTRKLDLHGFSLNEANKLVKKFIVESFKDGHKKLLIITGKGLRSKVHDNPYVSEEMSVLKHSVPAFLKNDEDLFSKISKISTADIKDGGDGAFYIYLKN